MSVLTGGHRLKNLLAGRMTSTMLVIRNSFPRTVLASVPSNTHLTRKYPDRLLIEGDSTIGSLRLLPRSIIISLEVASIKQWRGKTVVNLLHKIGHFPLWVKFPFTFGHDNGSSEHEHKVSFPEDSRFNKLVICSNHVSAVELEVLERIKAMFFKCI